ncbi:MAG: hypothetical protein ACLRVT_06410, partial [Oscillospiraceae bacterium]
DFLYNKSRNARSSAGFACCSGSDRYSAGLWRCHMKEGFSDCGPWGRALMGLLRHCAADYLLKKRFGVRKLSYRQENPRLFRGAWTLPIFPKTAWICPDGRVY